MSTAKMIPIFDVTDSHLTSSDVPEDDHPAWASGTTYAAGAKVIHNHKIWESVQSANAGHEPVDASGEWWTDLGATNRWAVFDGHLQNQTSQAESANWKITPSDVITTVSLFNIQASSVTVTMTDPVEGVIYDETRYLTGGAGIIDAWTYFFNRIYTTDNVILSDLPAYANAEISITVDGGTGGNIAVGQIAIGYVEVLGRVLNEVMLGIDDYTRLNEDAFGRTSPAIRGYARTATVAIMVQTDYVPFLEKLIAEQRGKTTVWAFDTRYGENELAYVGFYKSMSFLYQYAQASVLDLEIRSLV